MEISSFVSLGIISSIWRVDQFTWQGIPALASGCPQETGKAALPPTIDLTCNKPWNWHRLPFATSRKPHECFNTCGKSEPRFSSCQTTFKPLLHFPASLPASWALSLTARPGAQPASIIPAFRISAHKPVTCKSPKRQSSICLFPLCQMKESRRGRAEEWPVKGEASLPTSKRQFGVLATQ